MDPRSTTGGTRRASRGNGAVNSQQTSCGGQLTDDVLLEICGVARGDAAVNSEWVAELRRVPRVVGRARVGAGLRLERGQTLLASVLGRLPRFNPVHLPFGYMGPRQRSRDWVDRETLERIGKQIVGLLWTETPAGTVANAVQRGVSEAVRLGFLDQRQYDAWRPGMPSGSGWRCMLRATPYGVRRANSREGMPQGVGTPTGHLAANGTTDTSPPVPDNKAAPRNAPTVQLGRPGEPCIVLGRRKPPLTDAQHAVVSALVEAGDAGLNKDALEVVRPSARRILKKLCEDADWAAAIVLPGQTNGRYRIRTSTCARPEQTAMSTFDHL